MVALGVTNCSLSPSKWSANRNTAGASIVQKVPGTAAATSSGQDGGVVGGGGNGIRTSTGSSDGVQGGGWGALPLPLKPLSPKFNACSRSKEVLLRSSNRLAPSITSSSSRSQVMLLPSSAPVAAPPKLVAGAEAVRRRLRMGVRDTSPKTSTNVFLTHHAGGYCKQSLSSESSYSLTSQALSAVDVAPDVLPLADVGNCGRLAKLCIAVPSSRSTGRASSPKDAICEVSMVRYKLLPSLSA